MDYSVDFVAGLDDDLDRVEAQSMSDAALWIELINLIYDVEGVRAELTVSNGYRSAQPRFDTLPVQGLLRLGYNISRVKLYRANGSTNPYRLLYSLDHRGENTIVLLGLMPRSEDYERNSEIIQRAISDYDSRGIPRVPRV